MLLAVRPSNVNSLNTSRVHAVVLLNVAKIDNLEQVFPSRLRVKLKGSSQKSMYHLSVNAYNLRFGLSLEKCVA